jgi:hypothetical protein
VAKCAHFLLCIRPELLLLMLLMLMLSLLLLQAV